MIVQSRDKVNDAILKSAIVEFKKGYSNASMRVIAGNAGTTTGSIYSRYHSKQELFKAVVGETAEGLKEIIRTCLTNIMYSNENSDEGIYKSYYTKTMFCLADYIYDHYSEAEILVNCADETTYQDYILQLVRIEFEYMNSLWPEKHMNKQLSDDLIYIITKIFYSNFFDLILHNGKENKTELVELLIQHHILGWNVLIAKLEDSKSMMT